MEKDLGGLYIEESKKEMIFPSDYPVKAEQQDKMDHENKLIVEKSTLDVSGEIINSESVNDVTAKQDLMINTVIDCFNKFGPMRAVADKELDSIKATFNWERLELMRHLNSWVSVSIESSTETPSPPKESELECLNNLGLAYNVINVIINTHTSSPTVSFKFYYRIDLKDEFEDESEVSKYEWKVMKKLPNIRARKVKGICDQNIIEASLLESVRPSVDPLKAKVDLHKIGSSVSSKKRNASEISENSTVPALGKKKARYQH